MPCATNQMQGFRLEFVGEGHNSPSFNARLPKVKSFCAISRSAHLSCALALSELAAVQLFEKEAGHEHEKML